MKARCLAAVLLVLSGPATACEYLTHHFILCSEGTPWATGRWEQGGDSATLYVGDIGYDGYEGYYDRDPAKTLAQGMAAYKANDAKGNQVVPMMQDSLASPDMAFERIIRQVRNDSFHEIRVTMLAEVTSGPHQVGQRILLSLRAPLDTPLADLNKLSRDYAALVYPRNLPEGE